MTDRAIFLDRDGTLVQPRHYPSRPQDLVLYGDAAPELCRLRSGGFRLVVVTNQSGLARGYFTRDDLQRMHDHLTRELASRSVHLDAIYACPHHVEGVIPEFAVPCDCRKPKPGMLLQAATDLQLDLDRSWLVGDILDDVEAGNRAGCRTVLVDLGTEPLPTHAYRRPDFVARSTRHALQIIATVEGLGGQAGLTYRPPAWRGSAPAPAGVAPLGELNG